MDRYLFRNYEVYRQSTDFTTHSEVKENIQSFLDTSVTTEKPGIEFEEFKKHLQEVIDENGDYVNF